MIKGLSLTLALLLTFARSTVVSAQAPDPNVLLKTAEKYYEDLEYTKSLKILLALQQNKALTPVQRARAFLYMGVCFTALGKAQHAVQSFAEVLKLRPRFRLPPGVSPSIRAMFMAALKRLKLPAVAPKGPAGPPKKLEPVDFSVKGPIEAVAGAPIELTLTIDDPGRRIWHFMIHWRRIGGDDYSKVKVKRRGKKPKVNATIPGATIGSKTGSLVYYVEAKNREGKTIARDGDLDDPFEVQLKEGGKGGGALSWWTLGIIGGAAAVAGGVAAIVLLSQGGGSSNTSAADVVVVVQ